MNNPRLHLSLTWRNRLVYAIVFLFPIVVATLRDAASTLYGLLVVLSLFYCQRAWQLLDPKEKRFLIALGLFFSFSFLSLLMTEDLREGFKRSERYFRLILLIPIYLMLRREQIDTAKPFMLGICGAVLVMMGQAVYQVSFLKETVAHGAYHKIILGDLAILFSTLIFIGVLFFGRKKADYLLAIPAILAGTYTSLLSGTRTAWFFVPVIFVCLLWMCRKDFNPKAWTRITIGIGICLLLLGGLQPKRLTEGLAQGLSDLKTFQQDPAIETSWGSRLVMWHNSILIFKDSPIIGTGMGDFKTDSQMLYDKGLSYSNDFALNQSHAHNLYLQLLAEGGIMGVILLTVALFVFPFLFLHALGRRTSDKPLRFYTLSGIIGVLAFAWFGISESWALRNPMITAYCMVMLVFMTSAANRKSGNTSSPPI